MRRRDGLIYCVSGPIVRGTLLILGVACTGIAYGASTSSTGNEEAGKYIQVYNVDETKSAWESDKLDSLVTAISRRIHKIVGDDIAVKALGTNRVEITIPVAQGSAHAETKAKTEQIQKLISMTGAVEFRIVATQRFDQSVIERAKEIRKAAWAKLPGTEDGRVIYRIDPKTGQKAIDPKTGKPTELAKWCRVRNARAKQPDLASEPAALKLSQKNADGSETDQFEILVLAPESDSYNVTGKNIRKASARPIPEGFGFEVDLEFSADGSGKLGRLTAEHLPLDGGIFKYKLAVVLDDVVLFAPYIIDRISDRARITGDFDRQEAMALSEIINFGALPAVLDPTPASESFEKVTPAASDK